ncbi:hypothetical protein BO94DRAFT_593529 [Aspergillus sclerotioniger CBS 115572]|uniref:Rhodopsin domain-containing protein n=1 Tax=Aspergillus sclerotioniger CBS 115572 TaxID=1450535 RepID=A0A317WZC4_9EURO|nr:hypothetical protein BO94DRAFT_593529 [Aspergillus sclerotioniger CBS 115572]PWY90617.1 hypothetical protein BO94DRAFT_593529 [Aspergillus sclerotioniger CBS 115572]
MASEPAADTLPDQISPHYVVFIGVGAMMTFLSTASVAIRFVSRVLTISVKWDDWACLGALVFAYGFMITTVVVAIVGRAGYHIAQYDAHTLEKYLQIALANNILYNNSVSLAKVSILLFYRRIFAVSRLFTIVFWALGALIAGYWFSAVGGLIFSTNPIDAQWKAWIPHTNIKDKTFWIAMGIANILLDFTLLCIPQPFVWRLHQTRQRKLLLSLVFCLGGFVCVTSIVRLYYLATVSMDDLTCTLTTPGIWTLVETNMTIICACLPTIPGLVQYLKRCSDTNGSSKRSNAYLVPSAKKFLFDYGRFNRSPKSSSTQGLYTDIEAGCPSENFQLGDVRSVHVQTDLQVKWDNRSGP